MFLSVFTAVRQTDNSVVVTLRSMAQPVNVTVTLGTMSMGVFQPSPKYQTAEVPTTQSLPLPFQAPTTGLTTVQAVDNDKQDRQPVYTNISSPPP